jgi:hypothetical protein
MTLVKYVFFFKQISKIKKHFFQKFQWHATLYIENYRFWEKMQKIEFHCCIMIYHCTVYSDFAAHI